MNWKKATVVFIILTIAAIAVYDVLAIQHGGKDASISWTLIVWSHEYPSFTFLMGFTMGHLFWRMRNPNLTCQKCGAKIDDKIQTTKGES